VLLVFCIVVLIISFLIYVGQPLSTSSQAR